MANLTFYNANQTLSTTLVVPTPLATTSINLPVSGTLATTADVSTAKTEAINSGLGVGQTWQDVLSTRNVGTTYTNSTGKPIMIFIQNSSPGSGTSASTLTINGVQLGTIASGTLNVQTMGGSILIPAGATYSVAFTGTGSIAIWKELR